MFEFLTAMSMVSGLHVAPDQIKISGMLDRYQKLALEPKALVVKFQSVDPIDKKVSRGLYAIDRSQARSSWVLKTDLDVPGKVPHLISMVDSKFVHLNPNNQKLVVSNEYEEMRRSFEDRWCHIAFMIADSQRAKRRFQMHIAFEDQNYTVVRFQPVEKPNYWFTLQSSHDEYVTFCRKTFDNLPIGSIRRVCCSHNDIRIDAWLKDDRSDTTIFPIVVPPLPAGWVLDNHDTILVKPPKRIDTDATKPKD